MLYVAFGVDHLDLSTIQPGSPIIVVHNDNLLDPETERSTGPAKSSRVLHLQGHGNVGFAAGANLGVQHVLTSRVIFCNPDTSLHDEHWSALTNATPDEVVSVPMVDDAGRPASVVNSYPTALALALTGFGAGRVAPRGSFARRALQSLLGRWGSAHADSARAGTRPLSEAWCSGAVFSVDTLRLRSVRGFDEGYFLYFEDADLCSRLAVAFPQMTVRVADTRPALHQVGGSARSVEVQQAVKRHFVASALRYARRHQGLVWIAVRAALRLRAAWLVRR